jgi:serine/threonine protein kinase
MAGLTEDARFQNLRRLGHGGFGDVYAGLDAERGVEVAIKKLKLTGPESIYRFKQEFRAVEAIDHPNLVQLFELLQAGEDWVFTMELVTGDDFTRFVRPGGELDLRRLRDALRQLAAGLAHLHAAGKLHLDVKPANVLIRRDGRLKLVDFGLAADTDVARDDRTTDRSAGTL